MNEWVNGLTCFEIFELRDKLLDVSSEDLFGRMHSDLEWIYRTGN